MKAQDILKRNDSNLSIDEIKDFLKKEDVLLSEEFIDFILTYDKSELYSSNILIKRMFSTGSEQEFLLGGFLSFQEFKDSYEYFYKVNAEEEVVDAAVAIIGRTNGRTCICIGIREDNLGQIFLWDGDFGVTKQAETLKVFFDSLLIDNSHI